MKGEDLYKKILIVAGMIMLCIAIIYFCTYDKSKADINKIKTEKELENVIYSNEKNVFDDDIIANLIIEKIGLRAPVKLGSSSEILKQYIGHIENTPMYDGNIGLAAHNRGYEYSYFARLNELEEGDKIIYKTEYGERSYIVDNRKIILETDWSLFEDTKENKLTMITCITNKPNQRLCVQATEIK